MPEAAGKNLRALAVESITHHPSIPTCRGPFLALAGDSLQWREANAQFRRVRLIGCVTTLLSLVIRRCTTIGACEDVRNAPASILRLAGRLAKILL